MVLFSIKLLNNVRKAIAGRRFPKQLAAAVALGALLGVVPHGNLLAVVILVTILCCQINHALMATVAICVSFGATRLDQYSHQAGQFILDHPAIQPYAISAWQLPFIPWTDLNNTVVMGSFVIGLAAALPIYYLTLPLFRLIAPEETEQESKKADSESEDKLRLDAAHAAESLPQPSLSTLPISATAEDETSSEIIDQRDDSATSKHSVSLVIDGEQPIQPPRFSSPGDAVGSTELQQATNPESLQRAACSQDPIFVPIDGRKGLGEVQESKLPTYQEMVAVETRIDVIRMQGPTEPTQSSADTSDAKTDHPNTETNHEQPMDEALSYLLCQLRHSQERKAAG